MITEIDKKITDEFVYEVTIKVEAAKLESYYQTTFNLKQPEVSINRAIRASKIDKERVKKITVTALQQLSYSQI